MPVDTPIRLTTRAGIDLAVRPAEPADEPALMQLFAELSEEDRRFRFLSACRVGHEQLAPLLGADHDGSESYLAFDAASGALVASAMLACDADRETAEVAVAIRAVDRGKGIGWALLDLLAREAEARGIRRILSVESRENHAAITLEREMGFVASPCDDDPAAVILTRTIR